MAKESDRPPFTPRQPNEKPVRPVPHHPEFGKPSPLRRIQPAPSALPFNVPKPHQPRPEHHRPRPQNAIPHTPGQQQKTSRNIGIADRSSQPWNPLKPVRPSKYDDDDDVVEIKRPENVTFGTPKGPKTLFSSNGPVVPVAAPAAAPDLSKASKNILKFKEFTGPELPNPTTDFRRFPSSAFGSVDANSYVDTAKANENIKALLQGAFEDEADKPDEGHKAGRRKRKGRSKKKKQEPVGEQYREQETNDDKKKLEVDVDDLASQFQGVGVADKSGESDEVHVDKTEKAAGEEDSGLKTRERSGSKDSETAGQENTTEDGASQDETSDDDEEDEEDDFAVEGLNVKLLPHQVDGVRWMREKEIGNKKGKGTIPRGGILADDMGLGKTIQAIALLLSNRKSTEGSQGDTAEDVKYKSKKSRVLSSSTLVVAPLALIKQWESEILTRVEKPHKLSVCLYHGGNRTKTADNLDEYDVVITTYGTLGSEYGATDYKSGLFSVYWYRIILDEAHTIKNRNAKGTQAACALNAEYRWCMTGTPLQNNLDEIQSLIKFLRIQPYSDLNAWREQITKPLSSGRGALATQRLHVYLKAFMKRRTKDVLKLSGGDGKSGGEGSKESSNGFQITKREVLRVDAEFTPAESNFYQRLEQRTGNSLDKMMGGSKLDYASALVLLLRLRQACNHPDLIKSDLAEDKDVLLQNGSNGNETSSTKRDDLDNVADLFGSLSVVTKKCDVCQTEMNKEETQAGSSRCRECELDLRYGLSVASDSKAKDFDEDGVGEGDDDDAYVEADDADARAVASTKIHHLMRILRRESSEYKFIVFSVFTSMLDKAEPFLRRAGIGFARYDGSMRNEHREESLNRLRNNKATRVLLCSLRAGALGLNLTAASRVVIMEPFWNPVSYRIHIFTRNCTNTPILTNLP